MSLGNLKFHSKGEKVTNWSWNLYKIEDDGTETLAVQKNGQSFYFTGPNGNYRADLTMQSSSNRKITGEKSFTLSWDDYLTSDLKSPVEASVASSGPSYVGYANTLSLVLSNPNRKSTLSKVEWYLSYNGGDYSLFSSGASATLIKFTPQDTGAYTIKAKTYHKYIASAVFETTPLSLNISGFSDITSGTLAVSRLDFKNFRFTLSVNLASFLKEKVTGGTITMTGLSSGESLATGAFAPSGVLSSKTVVNEMVSVSVSATTNLNRSISFTQQFDANIPDPYSTTGSIAEVPFAPKVSIALYDLSKLQYAVVTEEINYYLVNKYNGSVKVYNGTTVVTTNPDEQGFLVEFPEAGEKSLTYRLLKSDGTVVAEKTFSVDVLTADSLISQSINSVTIEAKTLDPVSRVVKVEAILNSDLTELLGDDKLKAAGITYGLKIKNQEGSQVMPKGAEASFSNKASGLITFAADAVGQFEALFYVSFNNQEYDTAVSTFTLDDVLSNLELFEISHTQVMTNKTWGLLQIVITPQVAYKQLKSMSWKTEILDSSGNILKDFGTQGKIGYAFPSPGNYAVRVTAFRKVDNSVYYTKKANLTLVNKPPVLNSATANVTVNKKGQDILNVSVVYSDPDSKSLTGAWTICGESYPNLRTKFSYLITSLATCGETYLVLTDGLGESTRYDFNIHDLIVDARTASNN